MITARVNSRILGHRPGDEIDIDLTPQIENLLLSGHLTLIAEPRPTEEVTDGGVDAQPGGAAEPPG